MLNAFAGHTPTRRFFLWRLVYGCLLLVLALLFLMPVQRNELGSEPGWWLLIFGALPSLAVVLMCRYRPALVSGGVTP